MSQGHHRDYDEWGFMRAWVASSIAVYPLAIILLVLGFFGMGFITNFLRPLLDSARITELLILVFVAGIIGFAIGWLQRGLMRRHLFWTADRWITYSAIGGIIGGLVVVGMMWLSQMLYFQSYGYTSFAYREAWTFNTFNIWAMPVFMLFVSAMQWLSLRQAVSRAWLWVIVNVLAGFIFVGLINNAGSSVSRNGFLYILFILLVPSTQGFVTGISLLYLFKRFGYPMVQPPVIKTDKAYAYATVPIEKNAPPRQPSVWDDAI
jgi:hypothetical protein